MSREIEDRFKYHAVDDAQIAAMSDVRAAILRAAKVVDETVPNPEAEVSLVKLEEALFHANAGISRGPSVAHRGRHRESARAAVAQMIDDAKKSGILAHNISDDAARATIMRGL